MEHKKKQPRNLVGPQIRRIRSQQGLTQEELAAKCQVLGHDISRSTLAKIEAQIRCATDYDIVAVAKALKVEVTKLLI